MKNRIDMSINTGVMVDLMADVDCVLHATDDINPDIVAVVNQAVLDQCVEKGIGFEPGKYNVRMLCVITKLE